MSDRHTDHRRTKAARHRGTIETMQNGFYMIAIDQIRHKPFSETQFNQFAQQLLNVLQRVTAKRRRPHDRSIAALLVEEIPGDLWEALERRAEHDAAVHERGATRVHDVVLRLLQAYAHVGLKPIESLRKPQCPPAR